MSDQADSNQIAPSHRLRESLTRLQSDYLLPTARTFHVIAACLALLTAVGGLLAALYFQTQTSTKPVFESLPAPYSSSATNLDIGIAARRLSPPTQLRFVVEGGIISSKLKEQQVLGYFDATSPNQLAKFPNDFAILGGKDAELFERTRYPQSERTGLAARAVLVHEINDAVEQATPSTRRSFIINIVAYDEFGNRSDPADVQFTLEYGAAAIKVVPTESPQVSLTDLERLARDISLLLDPEGTPKQFDVYRRALQVPADCRAQNNSEFTANFRRAFESVRQRLDANNIEAFYKGTCEAWQVALNAEQAARASAESARAAVASRNAERSAAAGIAHAGALVYRTTAMTVVGGALAVFLVIALFLAFLAIEGHSMAIRNAIDALANRAVDGSARDATSGQADERAL